MAVVYLKPLGPPVFVLSPHPGLLVPGNIDVAHLPVIIHGNQVSTVRSVSWQEPFRIGGRTRMLETLMPTVLGRSLVSSEDAERSYRRTGKHLGAFDNVAHANAYSNILHNYKGKDWARRKRLRARSVVPA